MFAREAADRKKPFLDLVEPARVEAEAIERVLDATLRLAEGDKCPVERLDRLVEQAIGLVRRMGQARERLA